MFFCYNGKRMGGKNMKYMWLDQFLQSMEKSTKDYKEEWGWERYMIGGKLFAAICKDASGIKDIITLKLDPLEGEFLREQYEEIVPGHYMNKTHWNSISLEGNVPEDLMKEMIKKSYLLVFNGLSKKQQKAIQSEN